MSKQLKGFNFPYHELNNKQNSIKNGKCINQISLILFKKIKYFLRVR